MTDRVSDGYRPSLRNTQDRKAFQSQRVHDSLEVLDESFEAEVFHVPIRKAVSSFVISHQQMVASKFLDHMTPDRTLPIEFQMIEPVRGLNQWRAIADRRIGDAHVIRGSAETDFLFQWDCVSN